MIVSTKMRLQRMGATKEPRYRIVVIDSGAGTDAGYIEKIGNYYPESTDEEDEYDVDEDLALEWLENGAKPSPTVKDILSEHEILEELEERRAEA